MISRTLWTVPRQSEWRDFDPVASNTAPIGAREAETISKIPPTVAVVTAEPVEEDQVEYIEPVSAPAPVERNPGTMVETIESVKTTAPTTVETSKTTVLSDMGAALEPVPTTIAPTRTTILPTREPYTVSKPPEFLTRLANQFR